MENIDNEILKFIPLDKSWVIRMGILDLINGKKDILDFLSKQKDLGEDLQALKRVAEKWESNEPFDVGESGAVYRFVRFYLWKNNINREIIKAGTLQNRKLCNNPDIITWQPEQLLTLDSKTSQWASMAYLLGKRRKVDNPPFKLQLTYDAVEHWEKQRKAGKAWEAGPDRTILNQAIAFINFLKTGEIYFMPEQAEDYCFARAFGLMDIEDGELMFPSLKGHESNRIEEAENSISQADNDQKITSNDHRIVQAVVMRQVARGKPFEVLNKNAVNKTWPRFWYFIEYCQAAYQKAR